MESLALGSCSPPPHGGTPLLPGQNLAARPVVSSVTASSSPLAIRGSTSASRGGGGRPPIVPPIPRRSTIRARLRRGSMRAGMTWRAAGCAGGGVTGSGNRAGVVVRRRLDDRVLSADRPTSMFPKKRAVEEGQGQGHWQGQGGGPSPPSPSPLTGGTNCQPIFPVGRQSWGVESGLKAGGVPEKLVTAVLVCIYGM